MSNFVFNLEIIYFFHNQHLDLINDEVGDEYHKIK
jgi:hypothetical protein